MCTSHWVWWDFLFISSNVIFFLSLSCWFRAKGKLSLSRRKFMLDAAVEKQHNQFMFLHVWYSLYEDTKIREAFECNSESLVLFLAFIRMRAKYKSQPFILQLNIKDLFSFLMVECVFIWTKLYIGADRMRTTHFFINSKNYI